jgi:hypothetical protein
MDPGRRRHYGAFYDTPPAGPLAVVWGNCQAEALRVALEPALPLTSVRVPPVHELTPADLPHLARLLPRTRLLLSQPVRADYRDLPIGTAQLRTHLPAGARVVVWPVVRYRGLHPWTAIVRHPRDPSAVPPVVPYHDLRTLVVAAGGRIGAPEAAAFRTVAARSVAELARRERRACDVGVSDLLVPLGLDAVHTLNHPANPLLRALARRVLEHLGLPAVVADPGRELLGGIRAPLDPAVLEALGLDPGRARPSWLVEGRAVHEVRERQRAWYAEHPEWVAAGLERYAADLETLDLWPEARGPMIGVRVQQQLATDRPACWSSPSDIASR